MCIDNTFSRNTSKMLTLDVTTNEGQDNDDDNDEAVALNQDMCGWLLKKRRKKMQGKIQ